ncbi:uncharacterized protein IL334_001676 [Kwoniella shivajii]|uniref:Uncharacterized protein n=1 Tax=Kwoniella shivajii TaxID=564305 RepID=A0ABZ1CTR0_9TREE|nr:hypothetical protein IL334_001676 [Kwoniella shivajii]
MIIRHRSISFLLFFVLTLLILSPLTQATSISPPEPRHTYVPITRSLDDRADHHPSSSSKPKYKKPEYVAHPAGNLVCRPFGECEPCPKDELDQPFCFPFGNRRLLHCIPASTSNTEDGNGNEKTGNGQVGEVPAWEACGKVIRKERRDFWEFVTANLLFLIVALTILWARTSALATEQYRQLAARIGIPSGGWT